MKRRAKALLALLVGALGCEGPDLGIPWDFERMLEQPRDEAYGETPLFDDRRAMRTPPPGSVARVAPGRRPPDLAGERPQATRALLERGRDRYAISCAPCHGLGGHATTPVAASMRLRPPPSLHLERLRERPVEAIANVIANGYGLMPSYAQLLDATDVFAVAWYVQALQRAERSRLEDLPPALRERAERELGEAP